MNNTFSLALALTLLATPVMAGEGSGDPFTFRAAPQLSAGASVTADTSSDAFPSLTGNTVGPSALASLTPGTGSETPVQTAASLPPRAGEGTVAFVQAARVNRALASRAARVRVTDTMQAMR